MNTQKTVALFFLSFVFVSCGGNSSGGESGNGDLEKTINGSLSESDDWSDGTYVDAYLIKNVEVDATIFVEVNPQGFDAFLTLYYVDEDDGNLEVYSEDSEYRGGLETFQYTADDSGDYLIEISSDGENETGKYTFTYRVRPDEDDNDEEEDDGDGGDDDDDPECTSNYECGSCHVCRDGSCYFSFAGDATGACL